jgi:nucleoside-diphosphate-sugar epimerase
MILVLGSSSYMGGIAVDALLTEGYQVVGIGRTVNHNMFKPYSANPKLDNFKEYHYDIVEDFEAIKDLIDRIRPTIVLNFIALGIVDDSWDYPSDYFDVNCSALVRIVQYLNTQTYLQKFIHSSTPEVYGNKPKLFKESKIYNPTTPYAACLHPDTLVLLSNGTEKAIKDIVIGDLVQSINTLTNKVESKNVTNVFKYNCKELLEVNIRNRKIRCTPNHKFLVKRPKRYNNKLDYRQDIGALNTTWVTAKELQKGDWVATTRENYGDITNYFNASFNRFLGYFVGDGYIKKGSKNITTTRQQTITLADEKKDFVEYYINLIGGGYLLKHKSKNCWYAYKGDISLVRQIQSLGLDKKAVNKVLPQEIINNSIDNIKEFLGGYFDADGCYCNNKLEFGSHSPVLIRQIKYLLSRLGIYSYINGDKVIITDSKSVGLFFDTIPSLKLYNKPCPIIKSQRTNEGNIVWQPIDKPLLSNYCGDVIDIEVADNHNYIIEQDIISHNSKAAFDMYLEVMYKQYRFPYVLSRFANIYGSCQQLFRIVPKTLTTIHNCGILRLDGNGETRRSFVHRKDVAKGIIDLVNTGKHDKVYHFSGSEYLSVKELVEFTCYLTGYNFNNLVTNSPDRRGKDLDYNMDSSLANSELGWNSTVSLEEGILETDKWLIENWEVFNKGGL